MVRACFQRCRMLLTITMVVAMIPAVTTAITIDVPDSSAPWLGYMNVFELPANGGGYVFGSPWGIGDLVATFDDPNHKVTLAPNTIGDPSPFWYIGGGGPGAPGNKNMEANLYIEETGPLAGQTVTFQGNVLANSYTSAHTAFVFIRDFAPDYSSSVDNIVPLPSSPGPFSISLATINDPSRHVQYGFRTVGVNVWVTDVTPFGNVMIATVPEPGTLMWILGAAFVVVRRVRG